MAFNVLALGFPEVEVPVRIANLDLLSGLAVQIQELLPGALPRRCPYLLPLPL